MVSKKPPDSQRDSSRQGEGSSSLMNQFHLEDDDEDAQKDKFLTFKLGKEEFGIDIGHVIEIVGMQEISEIPDMPEFIKGVINLRGAVIPVIDVRARFLMEGRAYDDRTCVIVVSIDSLAVGLVVDTVREVATISEDKISPPPQIRDDGSANYIKGMGRLEGEVKILLDVNKLLFENHLESLKKSAS